MLFCTAVHLGSGVDLLLLLFYYLVFLSKYGKITTWGKSKLVNIFSLYFQNEMKIWMTSALCLCIVPKHHTFDRKVYSADYHAHTIVSFMPFFLYPDYHRKTSQQQHRFFAISVPILSLLSGRCVAQLGFSLTFFCCPRNRVLSTSFTAK